MRPCLGVGRHYCGVLVRAGRPRCDSCRRANERIKSANRPAWERRFYGSAAWQRLRAQVMAEEDACAWCGARDVPLTAGHIRSVRQFSDLALDRANVRASCRSCQISHQHRTPSAA